MLIWKLREPKHRLKISKNRYPDEDYRTPEQQALDAEQAEGTAETVEPVETAEAVEPEVVEKTCNIWS